MISITEIYHCSRASSYCGSLLW